MTATKEQERKALAQIKKIVESLGEDSYIAVAFDGCFEKAETNIENDFHCSWKAIAENAQKNVEHYEEAFEQKEEEIVELRLELAQREVEVEKLKANTLGRNELERVAYIVSQRVMQAEGEALEAGDKIIELADDSQTEEFKEAVRKHRNIMSVVERTRQLDKRINSILAGGNSNE